MRIKDEIIWWWYLRYMREEETKGYQDVTPKGEIARWWNLQDMREEE